jgi:aminocarboxymuconate-semialdehyde decarboxylase
MPLFDLMAELDRPVWLHPNRGADFADYKTETKSLYEIWQVLGWPYESSVAMARLVFSGLFDRHPDIKIITHHMGAMIPYLEGRVGPGWDQLGSRTSDEDYSLLLKRLKKRPVDYFHMFYADTALNGAREATLFGLKFFGAERTLFATDAPFDPEKGSAFIRWGIDILDTLEITPAERQAIYEGNARRLLKLK